MNNEQIKTDLHNIIDICYTLIGSEELNSINSNRIVTALLILQEEQEKIDLEDVLSF